MARVLVIDDDVGLLQMVKLMLEREGHQPILAEGGEAGIQAALTQSPDVAIIDLMMPGISGYDVTRQLRANPATARMPILILTARSQPMDKQMAANAGASAFMSKPVASRELTARIAEIIASTGYKSSLPPATVSPSNTGSAPSIRRLPIGVDASEVTPPPPTAQSTPTAQPALIRPLTPPTIRKPEKQLPVIAVLSMRTGAGGTTLAINLAFMLRSMVERVCLLDLNTSNGSVGPYLRLALRTSWADLLPLGDKFDARAVGQVITAHPQPGIGIVGAPLTPPPRTLSSEAALTLLNTLAAGFQQIIVDVGSLNPASSAALTSARTIIAVVGDDPAAVQASTGLVQTLQSLAIDPKNVRLVVNRNHLEMGLPLQNIASALGMAVNAELPYDVNQTQAQRRGIPSVVMAPESAFALALQQLSRTL